MAEAKLGPVVFTVIKGELRQSKRMDYHTNMNAYTHKYTETHIEHIVRPYRA